MTTLALSPALPPLVRASSDTPTTQSRMYAHTLAHSEWYFEYPKAWVARPNTLRPGVVISDFQVSSEC